MATSTTDAQRRLFAGAMDLLAVEGFGSLKVRRLCQHIGVTTGAFYHSFDSWQDFTALFLEDWHRERTLRIVELVAVEADPRQRIELLLQTGASLPHAAEAAIRVWAGVDPEVRKLQSQVDHERVAAVTAAFLAYVGDPDEAEALARAAFYAVIGYEQSEGQRDPVAFERILRLVQASADELVASRST